MARRVGPLLVAVAAAVVLALGLLSDGGGRSPTRTTAPSAAAPIPPDSSAPLPSRPGRPPSQTLAVPPCAGCATTTVTETAPSPAPAGVPVVVTGTAAVGVLPTAAPPPTPSTRTTPAPPADPYLRSEVGCASGLDAAGLDAFFAERRGAVLGWDYAHAQPLPDGRVAWFFQDAFVDHGGSASSLAAAHLVRNVAVIQQGACFALVHQGTPERPQAFERGDGDTAGQRWWWPLGSQVRGDRLDVVWVEMVADPFFPRTGPGLPWLPRSTWLGTYRVSDLHRVAFRPAPDRGVDPIYGYAVASDDQHTYLFGNSYQQNLHREGGVLVPHSATSMYLARVPLGRLDLPPEYWDGVGWSPDRGAAAIISRRFWFENPMQPRWMDGRWVSVTKEDGYYGDEVTVDVAPAPQGPWLEVARVEAPLRRSDHQLVSYHAHLLPWRAADGGLLVTLSQNERIALWRPAREPWMYRQVVMRLDWPAAEPPPTTTTTLPPTTSTTLPPTTSTTLPPTTSTTTPSTTSTTLPPTTASTTAPPTTSTTVSSTTTAVADPAGGPVTATARAAPPGAPARPASP